MVGGEPYYEITAHTRRDMRDELSSHHAEIQRDGSNLQTRTRAVRGPPRWAGTVIWDFSDSEL